MPARWSAGRRGALLRAAAAASLTLPMLLAACVVQAPQESTPASSAPLAISRSTAAVPPSPTPAPEPQAPAPPETADTPDPLLNEATSDPTAGPPAPGTSAPEAVEDPDDPTPAPAPPTARPNSTAAAGTVTAYYVLLDDGGRNGVRFGCNDSLVGIARQGSASEEALPAAFRALLETPGGAAPPALEAGVYNALSGSRLKFLSGSFDGTTVTVYLAGVLRPGGTCDLPRLEAQLTHTAVAAAGAIKAEIYVNGRSLGEALGLD